ncbi:MAG TPA: hypothetical protein VGF45_08490 [Polyangia bacterium]
MSQHSSNIPRIYYLAALGTLVENMPSSGADERELIARAVTGELTDEDKATLWDLADLLREQSETPM